VVSSRSLTSSKRPDQAADDALSEVLRAVRFGHDSEAAFSRAFKKATGTSPAAFRSARGG
jgi:AraC-like DNA-binding protein